MNEDEVKAIQDITDAFKLSLEKMDEINKRVVKAVIVVPIVIAFCLSSVMAWFTWNYFSEDYYYPNVTTTTTGNHNSGSEVIK